MGFFACTEMKHLTSGSFAFLIILLVAGCGHGDDDRSTADNRATPRELFVCNLDHISVFDAAVNGNFPPKTIFAAATDAEGFIAGMAVDDIHDEVFVTGNDAIRVYGYSPQGDIELRRTITGESTSLAAPAGIAVDATDDEIFVTNFSNSSITVYPRMANGNVAPLRTISGDATGLDSPRDIAVDLVNDEILVVTRGAHLLVFEEKSTGNVNPRRTLSYPEPAEFGGIALDAGHDEVFVTRFTIIDRYHFTTAVMAYERSAQGNAVPLRTIVPEPADLQGPLRGLAVDVANDELFVVHSAYANSGYSIAVYERTANGSVAPRRLIEGDATELNAPSGVALRAL